MHFSKLCKYFKIYDYALTGSRILQKQEKSKSSYKGRFDKGLWYIMFGFSIYIYGTYVSVSIYIIWVKNRVSIEQFSMNLYGSHVVYMHNKIIRSNIFILILIAIYAFSGRLII